MSYCFCFFFLTFNLFVFSQFYKLYLALRDLIRIRQGIKFQDIKRNMFKRGISNFRESGDRSKNSTFFLFAPKDPFGESFSKTILKSASEFLFWKKYESSKSAKTYLICIISIGLSVHFHNARTRQRKIVLDSFFHKLFFIPRSSFATIFHLQADFLSFVTTRVKYTIFSIPFVR